MNKTQPSQHVMDSIDSPQPGVGMHGEDALDEQPFYELMQAYRMAPAFDQAAVIVAFEAVKTFVRDYIQSELE